MDRDVWDNDATSTRRAVIGAVGLAALGGCIESGNGDSDGNASFSMEATDRQLLDEAPSIVIEDVDDPVTVRASAIDGADVEWRSEATFAPEDGRVDVSQHAPQSGDYDRVDPRGLLWAMEPEGLNVTGYQYAQGAQRVELEARPASEEPSTEPVTTAEIERIVVREDVSNRTLEGPVYGELFEPASSEPAPGVVLMHGSGGYPLVDDAAVLASRGFTVLALQYFSPEYDALQDELFEVPVEYVEESIQWFRELDTVAESPIGLGGVSRGGELAMFVASRTDGIGALVNWVGSGVLWESYGDGVSGASSAWSLDGEPLPNPPAYPGNATEAELEAASVDLASIDCPILLFSGQDDAVWPSASLLDRTEQRLDQIDFEHEYAHHSYENAGHIAGPPGLPTYVFGPGGTFGGTPAGSAAAIGDSWPRAVDLFDSEIGQ